MKKIITFLLAPIIFSACSFHLLPNQDAMKFYDLDFSLNKSLSASACQNIIFQQNFLREVRVSAPYDGFQILVLKKDSSVSKLNDTQWISSLATLYKAELENFANTQCQGSDFIPFISTNLSTKTDSILSVDMYLAKLNFADEPATAEAGVSMTIRSERTGEVLKTVNKLSVERLDNLNSGAAALKKAILNSTMGCIENLKPSNID